MEQYLKICYEFQMDPIRLELEQIWATIAEERAQRQRLVTELQAALAGLPVDDLTPLGFGVTPAPPAPPVADLEEVIVEAPPPVPSVAVPVAGPPPSAADLSAGVCRRRRRRRVVSCGPRCLWRSAKPTSGSQIPADPPHQRTSSWQKPRPGMEGEPPGGDSG